MLTTRIKILSFVNGVSQVERVPVRPTVSNLPTLVDKWLGSPGTIVDVEPHILTVPTDPGYKALRERFYAPFERHLS